MKKILDNSGASMILWLMVAAFLMIVVTSVTGMINLTTQINPANQAAAVRDTIVRNIALYGSTARSLYVSRTPAANTALNNCLTLSGCAQGTTDFILLDGNNAPVTGTSSAPAYYSLDGTPCTTPLAKTGCFLKATTTLTVTCAPCNNLTTINIQINYSVTAATDSSTGRPVVLGLGGMVGTISGSGIQRTASYITTNGSP